MADKKGVPQRFSADLFSSPTSSSGLLGFDANFTSPFALVTPTKKEEGKSPCGRALIGAYTILLAAVTNHKEAYSLLQPSPCCRHKEVLQLLGALLQAVTLLQRNRLLRPLLRVTLLTLLVPMN